MKTLIVYSTKHGFTEKCAQILEQSLDGEVQKLDLTKGGEADLSKYDKIIIGGSIYMGQILKEVKTFCTKNLDTLKNKKVAFFICGMRDGAEAEQEINMAYPKELLETSITKGFFGGEFTFSKLNFLERFIVKKVTKSDKDSSTLSKENIDKFAKIINRA
ncbi:flavodoxin domain-containing protein [Clostridium sp. 'White wine YQ']|uniref:flavodoxin domain-containing protein n=1 Tax=Clostridium sp. 'White wine YQ' TaxID=3027474 RepID=UPI00236536B2|nr:flavodoxin domain-containing protein [Clostridium sp. 'White wine YQ']MDD7794809.1 flavodoxin domain-containing protein [Clostridium sp. 'White wine YQ']